MCMHWKAGWGLLLRTTQTWIKGLLAGAQARRLGQVRGPPSALVCLAVCRGIEPGDISTAAADGEDSLFDKRGESAGIAQSPSSC